MIFTWLIIIILALGLIQGYHSGFVAVFIHLVAYVLAWIIAMLFANKLADVAYSLYTAKIGTGSQFFTVPRALTGTIFFALFSVTYGIIRHIGKDLNMITKLPVVHLTNALLGAATSFLLRYLLIFLLLNVITLFPSTWIQHQYQTSVIAQQMVKQTPLMSKQLYRLWQDRSQN